MEIGKSQKGEMVEIRGDKMLGEDRRREKERQALEKPGSNGKRIVQVCNGLERIGKGVGECRGRMSSHITPLLKELRPRDCKGLSFLG